MYVHITCIYISVMNLHPHKLRWVRHNNVAKTFVIIFLTTLFPRFFMMNFWWKESTFVCANIHIHVIRCNVV